jgi:glycosyltransferase involved in cell wall biosynthesis
MRPEASRPSVVIAAHNEAAVIGRCIDALLDDCGPGGVDITVVANGCDDGTAAVASARTGVRVIELADRGKPGALNAGDRVAVGFPRIYLDADIVLPPGTVRTLTRALTAEDEGKDLPLAVVPRRHLDVAGRPLLVRSFYAINSRLPVYDNALFGRGVVALSAQGRGRFDEFPDMIADDLFLDSVFEPTEKRVVAQATVTVTTPHRTRDLLHRLVRVRTGNAALRVSAGSDEGVARVRPADRSSWLRHVVWRRPWLALAAACYVAITLVAAHRARRFGETVGWGRDESSRQPAPTHADATPAPSAPGDR